MAQDIRKLVEKDGPKGPVLSKGHVSRFERKLEHTFSDKKQGGFRLWMKIAAIAVVFLAVSIFGYLELSEEQSVPLAETESSEQNVNTNMITLGDLSPDLKKVENYYLAGINMQLASLDITNENKDLIDGYMKRLNELNQEYTILNKELNEVGPTEATITALIDNLKLRLELLFKLKNKLKELKNQNNENYTII